MNILLTKFPSAHLGPVDVDSDSHALSQSSWQLHTKGLPEMVTHGINQSLIEVVQDVTYNFHISNFQIMPFKQFL